MSEPFSLRPELSADLLGHINRGVFDRGVFAIPGEVIKPGTTPLGERVQPGDLITAELINFILARLDALERQPSPTAPTISPTIPTLTFVPTATVPTFTFPTIFTLPTATLGTFPTFPTIFTMPTLTLGPTGPIFTMVPTLTMGPTGPIFTMIPTLTMGPTGPIMTMGPGGLATMGPGGLATNLATGIGGLATMGGISPTMGGVTVRREDAVTVLPGVGRDEETRLTGAGIRNLGAVADADPVVLGNALGVEPGAAARMIGLARGALGPR